MAVLRYVKLRAILRAEVELVDFIHVVFDDADGKPDLLLSVYLADIIETPQVVAEHAASFANPPEEDTAGLLDLAGLVNGLQLAETKGKTRFRFTQDTHREVVQDDGSVVYGLATAAWIERAARNVSPSPEAVREHACDELKAGNAEWRALVNDKNKKKWRKWLQDCVPPPHPLDEDETKPPTEEG